MDDTTNLEDVIKASADSLEANGKAEKIILWYTENLLRIEAGSRSSGVASASSATWMSRFARRTPRIVAGSEAPRRRCAARP
jgi:hypothetical protein